MLWCRLILANCLIVLGRSELQPENHEGPSSTDSAAICNAECNRHLQIRLEAIEAAVRTIVSAVSSQTSDLFAPIKEIFQKDPSVRSILSINSTSSTVVNSKNFIFKNESTSTPPIKGHSNGNQLEKKTAVDNLKGAIKCSLAHLVDINTIDKNSYLNKSTDITVSLANESLEITWHIFSAECLKFTSGVWIRVHEISENEYQIQSETPLYVPQKCLKKKSKTSYSIVLFPPSSPSLTGKKNSCLFSLTRNLIQCLAYVVEVIPNYQSLRGKSLRAEIVIPPKLSKSEEFNFKSIISVAAHSNSLMLNWEDNSGCAPQLTSFTLKIFEDGIVDEAGRPNRTVTIPEFCLKRTRNEENLFSLVLPGIHSTCPIEWKPLDRCRKYKLDMSSQYSETWIGPSSSLEIFTGQEVVVNTTTDSISDSVWRCPKHHYWCSSDCLQINYYNEYICDGEGHCNNGIDEKYCDQTLCNNESGLRCGQQCVPKELFCDGKYDCLDGSDESGCKPGKICEQLTNPSGHFPLKKFSEPAFEIHPERNEDAVQETIVLITVQPNHQIWLTFHKFATVRKDIDFLKVYDGPYSTSPLLLSHSGSTIPPSVRSSSNELFVEFPSYYDKKYGIEGSYTSVKRTDELFKRGCGGYLNGEGIISTPSYLSDTDIADCFWLIEARQSDDLILLRKNSSTDKPQSAAFLSPWAYPEMIVYDGWSREGLVLYDTKYVEIREKMAIYSVSNKMMIHFKPPKVRENPVSYWNVSKIFTPQCKNNYEGTSGTIKSPNYPLLYPHLTDCRWTISVAPGSKVRLLFAFFETQEGSDYISVYDGPTVHEKLLLTESGFVPTPFVINSSTNQVLVRFTSDGDTSFSGFLAVYSSV